MINYTKLHPKPYILYPNKGWKADENFDTGIVKTIEWYLKKYGVIND